MAIIRITRELWDQLPEDKAKGLLLPNPITRESQLYFWDCDDVLIETEIEGFARTDVACPIYHKGENGIVSLVEIKHGEPLSNG
jgi:hypothetical protein